MENKELTPEKFFNTFHHSGDKITINFTEKTYYHKSIMFEFAKEYAQAKVEEYKQSQEQETTLFSAYLTGCGNANKRELGVPQRTFTDWYGDNIKTTS